MKKFYYSGRDYIGRTYKETYTRKSRYIMIRYNTAGNPFFIFQGRRYYLDNFLRTSNAWTGTASEEITANDGEKIRLAGYQAETFYKPLFIEIDEGGEAVRVYQYEGSETE